MESESDEVDVEDLLDRLKDLEETVDSQEDRLVIQQTIRTLDRLSARRIFGLDDLVQQIVGGIILSAPFVVTEEVWNLAASMNRLQWLITIIGSVVSIHCAGFHGYRTLRRRL